MVAWCVSKGLYSLQARRRPPSPRTFRFWCVLQENVHRCFGLLSTSIRPTRLSELSTLYATLYATIVSSHSPSEQPSRGVDGRLLVLCEEILRLSLPLIRTILRVNWALACFSFGPLVIRPNVRWGRSPAGLPDGGMGVGPLECGLGHGVHCAHWLDGFTFRNPTYRRTPGMYTDEGAS